MTGLVRARYTLEFKQEAVRLVRGGQTVSSMAKTLGLSDQTLHNWLKAEAAGGLREITGKVVSAEKMEIARLTAELAKTRMERDILKNRRGTEAACGHRNGLRAILAAEGSGRPLIGGEYPRKKTWSMGCCELESGDVFGRSRLGN